MHLLHQRGEYLAVGERLELSICLINNQVGYQLPDPTVEPVAGLAPALPLYERGGLLLSDTGWRARWVLPPSWRFCRPPRSLVRHAPEKINRKGSVVALHPHRSPTLFILRCALPSSCPAR